MRRILWCIISLCLILLSLALLLRFHDDADPLPAPLENVVSHVEGLTTKASRQARNVLINWFIYLSIVCYSR